MWNALIIRGVVLTLLVVTAGCSGLKPAATIDSSEKLESAEAKQTSNTLVYRDSSVDLKKYRRFILEPVVIYSGPDNDFGSIPEKNRQEMADFVRQCFIDTMTKDSGPGVVSAPGPDVLRVKFTLIGMTRTTRSLQALTMMNPIGIGVNVLKSASGGEGTFMGNVTLAAEFYDSQTGLLVSAFQAKRYPLPIDLIDLNNEYDAARSGIKDFMTAIRKGADAAAKKQ